MAAICKYYDEEATKEYLNQLARMHKVVLKAESEDDMKELIKSLESNSIKHYVWVEEPESLVSSVASAPDLKSVLQPFFKSFKLFK